MGDTWLPPPHVAFLPDSPLCTRSLSGSWASLTPSRLGALAVLSTKVFTLS